MNDDCLENGVWVISDYKILTYDGDYCWKYIDDFEYYDLRRDSEDMTKWTLYWEQFYDKVYLEETIYQEKNPKTIIFNNEFHIELEWKRYQ